MSLKTVDDEGLQEFMSSWVNLLESTFLFLLLPGASSPLNLSGKMWRPRSTQIEISLRILSYQAHHHRLVSLLDQPPLGKCAGTRHCYDGDLADLSPVPLEDVKISQLHKDGVAIGGFSGWGRF
ncbi:hypothetical protein T459_23459 [Capsicum annuum]|uniref:Uncharacterized protein n=1 Tax=Capsicum annuum TaxID=4072 RepID=A0A2G2YSL6_CAPAN|nr:hypothetical protein T459_23459 [Capsicum annuum]